MIFLKKRTLPQKANIFEASKRHRGFHFPVLKPVVMFKSSVVLGVTLLLSFGVQTLFTNAQITYKELANSAADATTTNDTSTTGNPHNDGWNWNNRNYYNNGYNGNYNYSYYTPPMPSFQYISTNPYQTPPNNNYNYTYNYNSTDTNGLSGQVIALQQQVGSTMQSCVNNARQGANQILAMKTQAKRMQDAIDNIHNQAGQIDTSTPGGQQRQDQMNNQADQMQNQLDNLNNAIGTAQDRYNSNNSTCRDNVSKLEQSRDDAEGKLDDAFGKAMDISTDLPDNVTQ